MVGEVDEQRAVVARTCAALQHTSITIQFDREAEAAGHPPDGGMPRQQYHCHLRQRQQYRIVRAHVFEFMREHEFLLAIVARKQPLRQHDFRAGDADHRGAGIVRDAYRRSVDRSERPVSTPTLVSHMHADKGTEQRDAGGRPRHQQPGVNADGHRAVPCGPRLLYGRRTQFRHVVPRCAERRQGGFGPGDGVDRRHRRCGLPHAIGDGCRRPSHRRQCTEYGGQEEPCDPRPPCWFPGDFERRFDAECGNGEQSAEQRELRNPPGDHASSPSRSARRRRIRSSSVRLSFSSATKCAKSFSADP